MKRPATFACAFAIAMLAVHGAVAWLTPIQAEDWDQWMWARIHEGDSSARWLVELLASHQTFSDLIEFAIARSSLFHAVVTPIVELALVLGVFVIGSRRRPRFDSWDDVLALAVLSMLLWIGAPRVGLAWFHRPYVAQWLYGITVALWVLAPFRCGWQLRRTGTVLMFVGGACAASSTRQIAVTMLVATLYATLRSPRRARWMWAAIAGLIAGSVLMFADSPQPDFRGFKPGFEWTLESLDKPVRETGELIALFLGLAFAKLVAGRLRPAWAGTVEPPDTSETLRWMSIWFGLLVLALFGPRFAPEAQLLPATVALAIGAYPIVVWLASSRPLRLVLAGAAIAVHLIAWTLALQTYLARGAEFRDRLARLQEGSGIVDVRPYGQIEPSFWFYGEDLEIARTRQLIAIQTFGLTDITLTPGGFRRYEPNTLLDIHLVIDGVTTDQLAAAHAPGIWATNPTSARHQFEDLIDELVPIAGTAFTARLEVGNLSVDVVHGRPIIVVSYEHGSLNTVKVTRKALDDDNRHILVTRPRSIATDYPEAYVISGSRTTPVVYNRGAYAVQPMTTELHGVIVCNTESCLLVDAFIPRL